MQQHAEVVEWCTSVEKARRAQSLTVLTGSAISMFPPTSLPAGQEATGWIQESLLGELGCPTGRQYARRLEWLVRDMPFESLLATLAVATSTDVARALLTELVTPCQPNRVHKTLARWMAHAAESPHANEPPLAVVTANYDCAIEHALDAIAREPTSTRIYYRVVDEGEARRRPSGCPILFKIHGSADQPGHPGLIYTHDQEARLRDWQIRLLHRFVDDRALLVLGYSGMDLDILPALATCHPTEIRSVRPVAGVEQDWYKIKTSSLARMKILHLGESADLRVVLKILEMLGDEEDLAAACSRLKRTKMSYDFSAQDKVDTGIRRQRVEDCLSVALASPDKRRWLGYALVWTGASRAGREILKSADPTPNEPLNVLALAEGLFYEGRYLSSAHEFRRLIQLRKSVRVPRTLAQLQYSLGASLNCAGDLLGAWKAILSLLRTAVWMAFQGDRRGAVCALTMFVPISLFCIPFASLIPFYVPLAQRIASISERARVVGPSLVLRRHTRPLITGLAFGQRAAEANEYRYQARRYTNRFARTARAEHARCAHRCWKQSAAWAKIIGDNASVAKAYFGLTRLYMLQHEHRYGDPDRTWRQGWSSGDNVELVGWRRVTGYGFRWLADRLAAQGLRGFLLRKLRNLAARAFDVS